MKNNRHKHKYSGAAKSPCGLFMDISVVLMSRIAIYERNLLPIRQTIQFEARSYSFSIFPTHLLTVYIQNSTLTL